MGLVDLHAPPPPLPLQSLQGGAVVPLTFLLTTVGCAVLFCSFPGSIPVRVGFSCHSDTNVCHRHSCFVPLSQQGWPGVDKCHWSLTLLT